MWNNRDDASFPNPIPDILQACRDAVARRLADAGPGTTPRAPEPQPPSSSSPGSPWGVRFAPTRPAATPASS